jgi:hypothetical protein
MTARVYRVAAMLLLSAFFSGRLHGESLASMSPKPRYPAIKTWHEQQLALGLTNDERLESLREVVRSGLHSGQRRLDRMFKNLEGEHVIDPTIPGVEKTILLTASSNQSVVKGASRALAYALDIHNDPRFKLLGVNIPTRSALGKTDKDLHFEHKATGFKIRAEVKDATPSSQRGDLPRIKDQIRKMAWEYRETREEQAWLNRREVIPEIKDFARQHGIRVYENVSVGKRANVREQTHFHEFLEDVDHRATVQAKLSALEGGIQAGTGLYLVYSSAPAAYSDLLVLHDPESRSLKTVIRFGTDVSRVAAGSSMLLSGSINLASGFSQTIRSSSRLMALSRWSGRAGLAAIIVSEGFVFLQYENGDISGYEVWVEQGKLGGVLIGSSAGAWAGEQIGTIVGAFFGPVGIPVGVIIGGVAGGIIGGYLGSMGVDYATTPSYRLKDEHTEKMFEQFICNYYGVK